VCVSQIKKELNVKVGEGTMNVRVKWYVFTFFFKCDVSTCRIIKFY